MPVYYKQFEILSHSFFWRPYLRWAYKKAFDDAKSLGLTIDRKKDFSCLLCGVSGEITAEEFIKFVHNKSKDAKITIIDFGEEQIKAIEELVESKFKNSDIKVLRMNAMGLGKFKAGQFDWIETDGFLEYFDQEDLNKLIFEWKRLLKPKGFITTREFATKSILGSLIDLIRIWAIKNYLGGRAYIHTRKDLVYTFQNAGLKFSEGFTPFPTYTRFCLIK